MKKYKIRHDLKHPTFQNLFRIEALISFSNVKAGQIGGFIEHEYNLNHDDDLWIDGDDFIYGKTNLAESRGQHE